MYRALSTLALLLATATAWAAPATITGQVVCSACWSEADRATTPYGTAADLECAARCAADGVPPALAVRTADGFELLELEGKHDWASLISAFVRAEGDRHDHDGTQAFVARSLDRLETNPWTEPFASRAPAWTDLSGHTLSLDGYRDRIVVLNFWATWCEPCRREMPELVEIQNEYGMYGVQVLGAAADAAEAADAVAGFARRLDVNFPVLLGATSEQMQAFGVGVALPATVVLDRNGRVAARFMGVVTRKKLRAALDELLDGDSAHGTRRAGREGAKIAAHGGHAHRHGSGTQASLVPS